MKSAESEGPAAEIIVTVAQAWPGLQYSRLGYRLTRRVPVQSLFDYLGGGHPITDFLEDFPTVTTEQVHQLLAETGLDGSRHVITVPT